MRPTASRPMKNASHQLPLGLAEVFQAQLRMLRDRYARELEKPLAARTAANALESLRRAARRRTLRLA